jgi:hypothetical protein
VVAPPWRDDDPASSIYLNGRVRLILEHEADGSGVHDQLPPHASGNLVSGENSGWHGHLVPKGSGSYEFKSFRQFDCRCHEGLFSRSVNGEYAELPTMSIRDMLMGVSYRFDHAGIHTPRASTVTDSCSEPAPDEVSASIAVSWREWPEDGMA